MKKILSFLMIAVLCCSFIISPVMAATIETDAGTVSTSDFPSSTVGNKAVYVLCQISNGQYGRNWFLYVISNEDSTVVDNIKAIYKGYSSSSLLHSVWFESAGGEILTVDAYRLENNSLNHRWTEARSFRQAINFYNDTLLYSSINVLNEDGSIFFEAPPASLEAVVMAMVKERIPETQGTILQQMRTILLCGVGCLALVIALNLLVKALRRFLPL